MEILEFDKNYNEHVNNLMHAILVDEFGFKHFSEGIINSQNEEYITGNNRLWIAVDNDEIIGTIGIIEVSETHALLKKIYVKESYRGQGIAQELLNLCLEYARSMNYNYVFLETYERLKRANSFYTKNDFTPYYEGYEKIQGDEIRYRLDLKKD